MSTRFDILDAKGEYERHNVEHRCTASDLSSRRCPERSAAWQRYMHVAGRWGHPEGDESHKERQERQYRERFGDPLKQSGG